MNREGVREHFVYWMFDAEDCCLYVGMTRQPEKRWKAHKSSKPEMVSRVAYKRMAGPFLLEDARRLERQQQEDLLPLYDGQRWINSNPDEDLPSSAVTFALRPEGLKRLRSEFNIRSDRELARRFHMNPSSVWRVLSGKSEVGTRFFTAAIQTFGAERIADLFDIVPAKRAAP